MMMKKLYTPAEIKVKLISSHQDVITASGISNHWADDIYDDANTWVTNEGGEN